MLSYAQAVVMGLLQGVAELFPISSLGHSVLLPGLLGWQINEQGDFFLIFLVATHLATAIVLFCFYWRDWMNILKGMGRSLRDREISAMNTDGKLGWLIVVATIPAGIIGLLFQQQIQSHLLSPRSAAFFLMLNGILLFVAERSRRRGTMQQATAPSTAHMAQLSWWQGIKVGAMEVLALLPGFSRTGSTLAGSLWIGLSHEDALRFSFLLATPIIGAAALVELPGLVISGNSAAISVALTGAAAAAVAAYLAVKFLSKYFQTIKTLTPFAIYCFAAGALSLIYLFARG